MAVRPRRSMLFMPGSNARAIQKTRMLDCDGIILDLEDAVAPEAKAAARDQVVSAVKDGGFGAREVFVRINGIDTPWHADDLDAVAHAAPNAILVPKISVPQPLEMLGQRLLDMAIDHKTRIWAMIETPLAVFNILSLAVLARDSETRLSGFIMGPNDLALETRARIVPGRLPMLGWFSTCIAAAHLYGIDILDGPYSDITDKEGFQRECTEGRDLGFDGKALIHPSQVAAANEVFSPSADEVAQAKKIVAAFDRAENKDKGVVQIDGRMVERLHAEMARRTLAIADSIASKR